MDFSFSDLNFNSVVIDNVAMLPSIENLHGFEARAAFLCKGKALRVNPVNSVTVFREDVDIVPTSWTIPSLTSLGAATIGCLSSSSASIDCLVIDLFDPKGLLQGQ